MISDRRLKVGVIAPFPFPMDRGSPMRALKICNSASRFCEVHVVTYHVGDSRPCSFRIHRIPNLKFSIKQPGPSFRKILSDLLLIFKVLRVFRRERINIAHAHLHEGALIGIIARRFLKVPLIYDAHGTLVEEMIASDFIRRGSISAAFWSWLERAIQSRADYVIAQSEMRKQALINDGVDADKITVIPDAPVWPSRMMKKADDLLDRYNLQSKKVIIYSGSLNYYQGIEILLKSLKKVCEKWNDVVLIIFGNSNASYYRKLAEQMGIAKNIVFVHDVPYDELPRFLSISNIAVAPRLYGKNVPGKILDYLASGVAIIGSDTEGILSIITNNENGLIFKSGDADDLHRKLDFLLMSPDVASRLGSSAKKLAESRFSWERNVDCIMKLYFQLAGFPIEF